MRVVSLVGARPQFIKAAMVSAQLRAQADVEEMLVHTGQHYSASLSEVFFKQLEIPRPDLNLEIGPGHPGAQIGRMLMGLDGVLETGAFDWVLVYGDTNSTLAGALAANKAGIPLAHVEAGLRSFNRQMPEEINRLAADHLAELLFTPTATADANLRAESIPEERIVRVGDVMYDSVLHYAERAARQSHILDDLNLEAGSYLVCTVHRAENTDDAHNLSAILEGIGQVAGQVPVVLPMHPRTQAAIKAHQLGTTLPDAIRVIEPLGYLDMLQLEANARLIATDSGGVQKEAFFLNIPCVTLRNETEWVELVEAGWNRLVPPADAASIAASIKSALDEPRPASAGSELFGDGHAAEKICARLLKS